MDPPKKSRALRNVSKKAPSATPKLQNNTTKSRAVLGDKTNQLTTVRALRSRKVYLNKSTESLVKVSKELFQSGGAKSQKAAAKKKPVTKKVASPQKRSKGCVAPKNIGEATEPKKKLVYKDTSPPSAEKEKNIPPQKKGALYDFKGSSGNSNTSARKQTRKRRPVKRKKKMLDNTSDEENCDVECVTKKVKDEKQKECFTLHSSMNSEMEHTLSNMSVKAERKFFKTPVRKELVEMNLFNFTNTGKRRLTKSSKNLIKRKEKIKASRAKENRVKPENSLQPGMFNCPEVGRRLKPAVDRSQIPSSCKTTAESRIPVLHKFAGVSGTKATGKSQVPLSHNTSTKLGIAETKIPLRYQRTAAIFGTKAVPSSHKPTSQCAIETETIGKVYDKIKTLCATMDTGAKVNDVMTNIENASHEVAPSQANSRHGATMNTGAKVFDVTSNIEDASHKVAASQVNCRRRATMSSTVDTCAEAVASTSAAMDAGAEAFASTSAAMETGGEVADVTTAVEEAAPREALAASQINYRRGGTFFGVNFTLSDAETDCSKKTEKSAVVNGAKATLLSTTNSTIPAKKVYAAAPSVGVMKRPQAVIQKTKDSTYFYGPLRANFREKYSKNRIEAVYVPAAPSVEQFTLENYFGFDEEPEEEYMLSPLKHQSVTEISAPPLTSTPHNSLIAQSKRLPSKPKRKVDVSKSAAALINQSQILAYGGYSRQKKSSETVTFAVPQLLSTAQSKPSMVQTSIASFMQSEKETSEVAFDTSLSNIEGDNELSVTHIKPPRRSYERPVRSKRRHVDQDDYVSEEEEEPKAKTFSRKHTRSKRLKRSKKQEKMYEKWASNVSIQFEEIDSVALIVE